MRPSCTPNCERQIDYQHPDTALSFSRVRKTEVDRVAQQPGHSAASASNGWRHQYEIVITQHGDSRIIFDQYGARHVFHPQDDGEFLPALSGSGSLKKNHSGYQWIPDTGMVHQFSGSYLTELVIPATEKLPRETLKLYYNNRKLSAVSDQQGNQLQLQHDQSGTVTITTPDSRRINYSVEYCPQPDHSEADACDTEANPVSGFMTADDTNSLTSAGITHVDARPASCQSYFTDYFGVERGTKIETALDELPPYSSMTPTVRSFPIVDFINGSELIVLRSRDLANDSFNNPANPNALLERLQRDGREIQTRLLDPLDKHNVITHTELGNTTTIVKHPDQRTVLQLLVRHQIASPEHWRQIEQARIQLLAKHGIRLEVVLIP